MNTKLVANHLLYLRKKQSLTQEELAEILKVSRQAISHWECGETIPDVSALLELSKLYGISINQILEPDTINGKLESFEDLHTISQNDLNIIRNSISVQTIVKAYMGTSPENARWLEENAKDIDFSEEKSKIGRVKVSDVESAQNEIVNMINLSVK